MTRRVRHPGRDARRVMTTAALVLGLVQLYVTGHQLLSADNLSYLDLGDLIVRGEWKAAMNGTWSPLYAALLGLWLRLLRPSAYWEALSVNVFSFLVYAAALASFGLLAHELSPSRRLSANRDAQAWPEPVWIAATYGVFMWVSLRLISVEIPVPDMLVSAVVYLLCALLVRMRSGYAGWPTFVAFGTLAGLGYLTKAAMFPIGCVFLISTVLAQRERRGAPWRSLLAGALFVVIASVWAVPLSLERGRVSIGNAGSLNYAIHVNRVQKSYWQGGPAGFGTPIHPPRQMLDRPRVYEFATPIRATFPPWFDPTYWYEGLRTPVVAHLQAKAVLKNLKVYHDEVLAPLRGFLAVIIVTLVASGAWAFVREVRGLGYVALPSLVALSLYAVVHVETRYVGGFIAVLCLILLAGLRTAGSRRLVTGVALAILLTLGIEICASLGERLYRRPAGHPGWEVAQALQQLGVRRGDAVAIVAGDHPDLYWARLAGVRVVAHVYGYRDEADSFWALDEASAADVLKRLARVGVRAVISQGAPPDAGRRGWVRLGGRNQHGRAVDASLARPGS